MSDLQQLEQELRDYTNIKKAKVLQKFFQTGEGEYGQGDKFLGIQVPEQREIVKKYYNLSLDDLQILLDSKVHEKRLIALLILMHKYKKSRENQRYEILDFYLKNTKNINNWDLVDLSCGEIVGNFLLDKNRDILYKLANSNLLWDRRIAIISTFSFIKENQFQDTLKISEILINDEQDLIQKAVGWMLREVGKRNQAVLEKFLQKHCKVMPRTMLRSAIEKFSEPTRDKYMVGDI